MKKLENIYGRVLQVGVVASLFLVFMTAPAANAVEGLSGGKIIMPWARTVAPGSFELEPAVSFTTFNEELDDDGESVDLDGRYQVTTIDVRFTGGLTDRFEMGAAFGIESENFHHDADPTLDESDTSLGDFALGWKYRLMGDNESDALALEWGIGLPWVSHDSYAVWEAGLIYSKALGDKLSMDIDSTYYFTTEASSGDPWYGLTYNLGIGYDFSDKFTLAGELNGFWERSRNDHVESWKITPAVGMAYGVNDILSVCMLVQRDFEGLGQNSELATGFQMLFTMAFE